MENSKIEWTDHTFNPWVGCSKVSPACDDCYAEAWAKRTGQHEQPWGEWRRRTSPANWKLAIKWDRQAQKAGVRKKVFCASLADVFDDQVPNEWRDDLWSLIERTQHLDWLLLTKRPENIKDMLPENWGDGWPNVWLGITVESQREANRRIPHFEQIPAIIKFLSCEPLLENLYLTLYGIDWVICGGESGSNARHMQEKWAQYLKLTCYENGVAFFMKQMSHNKEIPNYLNIRQFPKKYD